MLLQARDIAIDGVFDVGKRLLSALSLGDATRQRRNLGHEGTVLILLDGYPILHRPVFDIGGLKPFGRFGGVEPSIRVHCA